MADDARRVLALDSDRTVSLLLTVTVDIIVAHDGSVAGVELDVERLAGVGIDEVLVSLVVLCRRESQGGGVAGVALCAELASGDRARGTLEALDDLAVDRQGNS